MATRLVLSPVQQDCRSRRRQQYELIEDYEVTIDVVGNTVVIRVPAWTRTDFASVPGFLTWLYPPDGPWAGAAVVHDYLYQRDVATRLLADMIFRLLMVQAGVPWWRAAILYYSVRLFGRRFFNRRRGQIL